VLAVTGAKLQSKDTYDLTDSYVLVEAINPLLAYGLYVIGPTQSQVIRGNGPYLVYEVQPGEHYASVYDAGLHRWWRIRERQGVLYWETSPTCETWTTHAYLEHDLDLTAVRI